MEMDVNQKAAVETTGTNILVSASAGAGKTRVLVERLVKRCVEDHVGMDEILAVTFTEAAAAEMKNRVAASFQSLSENPDSVEQAEWLKQQMVLLSTADITTIDSFCLNLIRKYYSVIGLDPATIQNVLDESTQQAYRKEAFQQALARQHALRPDLLLQLLLSISPRSEDYSTIEEMVSNIQRMAEQHADPYAWLESMRHSYDNIHSWKDLPPIVYSSYFGQIKRYYDSIARSLERMIVSADESEKLKKKISSLTEAQNLLLSCKEALEARNYDAFREQFLIFGAEQKTPSDGKAETYTAIRKYFYKCCNSLTELLYESDVLIKDIGDLAPQIHMLCDLTEDTMRNYADIKKSAAAMDFTDMEQYAWIILNKNDHEVANLYRARLKEVMVDEFQDTSLLQDNIITALAKPGTIFRVGDVKQSIYRFRGARPSLMRGLMQDASIQNITLDHNYRSLEKIIRFSNLLFSRLMNIGGEDTYSERDTVSFGVPSQNRPDSNPIRLVLIEKPEEEEVSAEDESINYETEATKDKLMKATWIANEMIRLNRAGYRWNQFAVLVRSHAEKIILQRAFNTAHIPAAIDTREGFYNSDLCMYILALLTCIIDPEDDIALLTVLCGELFQFSDEELASLKLRYGSVRKGIRATHPEILKWFAHLQTISSRSLPEMLNEVSRYNSFYENLYDSEKANFDFLFEKTNAMASSLFTIHDLIEVMTLGEDEKSSNATCRSKDDDVVTVTTIHQSKGLQYKVVFLWGTGSNPMMDGRNMLIVDDQIGLGMKHVDLPWHTSRPSVFFTAASYRQGLADVEEYTRVLYVALTRAEETMYIVDLAKNKQDYEPDLSISDILKRKGITGLLTMALSPVEGLYEEVIVCPEDPIILSEYENRYVPELVRFHGDPSRLKVLQKPSEHELVTLPDLSPGSSSRGTRYGTFIHETVASLPNRVWTKNDFQSDDLREIDIAHLLRFSESDLYQKTLAMDIHKEMPFYAEDPDSSDRYMGVMDFVAFGEAEIVLIDFKTDALSPKEIQQRYSSQLNTYREALQILRPGTPVHAYAWSFHNDLAIKI
ncbi:MAG: UvrD-helicase domain-containing protein [Solobacterium sp.]|nr:UvrD-helicase domain-containing protein [Solobacterium sp.]